MKYLLIGYNDKGSAVGSFVLFAASAGIDVVKRNAMTMLHDAGIKCRSCSVQVAPSAPTESLNQSAGEGGAK